MTDDASPLLSFITVSFISSWETTEHFKGRMKIAFMIFVVWIFGAKPSADKQRPTAISYSVCHIDYESKTDVFICFACLLTHFWFIESRKFAILMQERVKLY